MLQNSFYAYEASLTYVKNLFKKMNPNPKESPINFKDSHDLEINKCYVADKMVSYKKCAFGETKQRTVDTGGIITGAQQSITRVK